MRLWLVAASAVGCGVPVARYAALEDGFDAAAAARDRSLAELDACRAEVRVGTEREEAAEAPRRVAEAALLQVAERGAGTVTGARLGLDPARWFVAGTAELSEEGRRLVPTLAAGLAAAPGAHVRLEVSGGDAPATLEYPTPWHLGADRAVALALALVAAGVPTDRLTAAATTGPASAYVVLDAAGSPGGR